MDILSQLKEKGHRLTKPRQEIVKVLADYPLTVQEIYSRLLKKNIHIDLASVYRNLELLLDMGVVYVLELGEGKKRYELVNKDKHHHHLICNNCGSIQDIVINEHEIMNEVTTKSQFKVDHHHLEFYGWCANCQ